MKKFIEENRRLLKFYSLASKVIGWALIWGGTLWFLLFALCILAARDAAGELRWPPLTENVTYATSAFIFDFVFLGLVALILSRLIEYTVQGEHPPGRLLRFGNVILYVYAGLVIGRAILTYHLWNLGVPVGYGAGHLLFAQPLVFPTLAKALILVGAGVILQRLLPVIEESKTLV
jgi:hypothetical protein